MHHHRVLKFVLLLLLVEAAVYSQESSLVASKILLPSYPREAVAARIQGEVVAECAIQDDGPYAEIKILSGHAVLAKEVASKLAKWRFNEEKVATRKTSNKKIVIYTVFKLEGTCMANNMNLCKQQQWYEYPNKIEILSEHLGEMP